jgi:hypothetical protein
MLRRALSAVSRTLRRGASLLARGADEVELLGLDLALASAEPAEVLARVDAVVDAVQPARLTHEAQELFAASSATSSPTTSSSTAAEPLEGSLEWRQRREAALRSA